jgi:hypothetical protein
VVPGFLGGEARVRWSVVGVGVVVVGGGVGIVV